MRWICSQTGGLQGHPRLRSFIHRRRQIGGLQGLPTLWVLFYRPLEIFALTCASTVRSITTRFLVVTMPQRDRPVVFDSLPFFCRETSTAFMSVGRLIRPFNHISAAMVLTTCSTGTSLPCLCRETSIAFMRIGSRISVAMVLTTRSPGSTAFMRVDSLKLFHMYFLSLEAECIGRRLFTYQRW